MTYLNTEIYTTETRGRTIINIENFDNDSLINLDLNDKELEILYNIIKEIKEYKTYPITKEYTKYKNNTIWEK